MNIVINIDILIFIKVALGLWVVASFSVCLGEISNAELTLSWRSQGIWRSPLILLGGNRPPVGYERGMCEVGDSKAIQCLSSAVVLA